MTSRASALLHVLASTAFAVALVGCGNGQTFGIAPGPPPPPEDAGVEPPPPPTRDAGPPPEEDAGPLPDNCTTTTRPLTATEDFDEFVGHGIHTEFGGTCLTCHSGRSPSGSGLTWGAAENTEQGWYDAVTTLLERADQVGLGPTETNLYKAFSRGIDVGGTYEAQHPNDDVGKEAALSWQTLRNEGVSETVCVDAGPDPDPVDCTPTLPTEAESETRFQSLGIGSGVATYNCQLCHVGGAKSSTGEDQAWGATTDDSAGWHDAFYGKALQESPTDVTQSVLYTHLNGSDGTHGVKATERDATEQWLDYVLNGELPAGCE